MNERLQALSNVVSSEQFTPVIMQFSTSVIKPGHQYVDHFYRDAIEVVYVLDGTSYIGVGGQYMKVKSNDCFVIFPGAIHNIYLNRKESCRIMDIIFKPGDAISIYNDIDLRKQLRFFFELEEKNIKYFRFSDNIGLKNLLESIELVLKKNSEKNNGYSYSYLKLDFCKMYLLFSEILDDMYHTLDKTENDYVKYAQRYVLENYCNTIRIEEMSEIIGISSRHLSRLFNKEFSMSVQDYINILKVDKARELLGTAEMNITEIAFFLGFSSSDYFTSFFKKHEGISPRAYRQKIHKTYEHSKRDLSEEL